MSSDFPTQRVKAYDGSRAALAEAKPTAELLSALLDSLTTGIALVDRDLRFLFINQQGAALNGLAMADHIGRRVSDVLPDVFPIIEPCFQEVFGTGESVRLAPFQAETQATQGMCWWDVRFHPVHDAEGSVIAVATVFVDASEKVTAETKLAETMQEMRTILDVVPVGLAIAHDRECTNMEFNGEFKRMRRLSPDATTEEWAALFQKHRYVFNGKEPAVHDLPLRKAATTGEPTEDGRIDISFADGGSVNILVRTAPLIIDGVRQGAVGAYVDITDLVRIQEQLQAANRVQYDFLAMVSHELRTPLTMILGNAQLLSRANGTFAEDERRSLATDVYREAVNLSYIVDNLLLMTRLDRGEKLQLEPVSLRHICNKVIQDLSFDGTSRCRCYCPDDVAVVSANSSSIEQVMRNLFSNALKYSPDTELVDMTLKVEGDEVIFSVADRGPGIDASDRERVFEPFFRAASTATRSGMGIGLAVCQRLLDAMGGRIWAEEREGGGSVFSFALEKLKVSED
jgi:PAS domain S-box-containing protein